MVIRALVKLLRATKPESSKKTTFLSSKLVPSYSFLLNVRNISTTTISLAIRKNRANKSTPTKEAIISTLNFKDAEDAAPFYALPISSLSQIQRITVSDVRNGLCKNRLYYISSRIQCPPAVLSEKLAKRTFVYRLSFQWLESSLNELLDKGVSGDRILRDLWVLKYHHKTICERLQRIKDNGIDRLFPWMVRCSPDVLNRYLQITLETKSILGESQSTHMYLANRLNVSIDEVERLCVKIPALKTIRATKIKHFMDFLIEEGFDIKQVAEKPWILAASQKTVKKRIEMLRTIGVMDINLNILHQSKKGFRKIFETLKDSKSGNTEIVKKVLQ